MSTPFPTCIHVIKQGKRQGEECGSKITQQCKRKQFCIKHLKNGSTTPVVKGSTKLHDAKKEKKPKKEKKSAVADVALDLSNCLAGAAGDDESTEVVEQEPGEEELDEEEPLEDIQEEEKVHEEDNPKNFEHTEAERVRVITEKRRQASLVPCRKTAPKEVVEEVEEEGEEDEEGGGDDLDDFKKLIDEIVDKLGNIYAMRANVVTIRTAVRELSSQLQEISISL